MKKTLLCICALSVCVAMLSACGTQEDTAQGETTLSSETTASVAETSAVTEADTESTTEETEPEPEISYQKKRAITYPADSDSYIAEEYEYGDDGYYKETHYNSDGNISYCEEYKNDIMIKNTSYYNGILNSITEYDESRINYIIKISYYNDNEELRDEMFWDYQFNEDQTEALVTSTSIQYNQDTGESSEFGPFYYKYIYEYDEAGYIIHEYHYNEELDQISSEEYYEYDDNGNNTMYNFANLSFFTYEYDNNNNLIHYNYSSNNNSSDTYYDYDEYGRQIGWTVYDADGNETSHSVVEY